MANEAQRAGPWLDAHGPSDTDEALLALHTAMDRSALGLGFASVEVWQIDLDGSAELVSHWPESSAVVVRDPSELDKVRHHLRDGGRGPVQIETALTPGASSVSLPVVAVEAADPSTRIGGYKSLALVATAGSQLGPVELGDRAAQLAALIEPYARWSAADEMRAAVRSVERAATVASLAVVSGGDTAAVGTALDRVRRALAADALALLESVNGRVVRVSQLVTADDLLSEPVEFLVSGPDGVDIDAVIAARFADTRMGRPNHAVSSLIDPKLVRRFPVLASIEMLATIPVGPRRQVLIAVARCAPRAFPPEAIDALAVFGALVGEVAERRLLQDRDERRTVAAQTISDAFAWGGRVDQTEAVDELPALIAALGAEQGLLSLRVEWEPARPLVCLPSVSWRAPEQSEAAPLASASRFTIGDSGENLGVIRATWPAGNGPPVGLRSLAGILHQAEERLRRKREAQAADRTRAALASVATRLVGADDLSLAETLSDVMGDFASVIEARALVLLTVDPLDRCYVVEASWSADGRPVLGSDGDAIAFGDHRGLDAARDTNRQVDLAGTEPMASYPACQFFPVGTSGSVNQLLMIGRTDTTVRQQVIVDAARRFSELLSSAVRRVATQRYASSAFDHSPVGMALLSDDGTIRSANQSLLDLLGLDDISELVGHTAWEFEAEPPLAAAWSNEGGIDTARLRLLRRNGAPWIGRLQRQRLNETKSRHWLIHVTDVTASDQAEARLRHRATHDLLTGLPNRRALEEAISSIAVERHTAALLMLDLNRFKNVNDSMGHVSGDELLKTVGARLRSASGLDDLVVRLGGDEFGVFLAGPTSRGETQALARRVLDAVAAPTVIDGQTVYTTASLGIALTDGDDRHELLRCADLAMYRAKDNGGDRHVTFDEELRRTIDARHRTETGLRIAIAEDRLEVAYQPEVDLVTGDLLGAEALMRWRNPDADLIDAEVFVDVAESSGLITPIGRRVLETACREAATWASADGRPLTLRVNLSAAELHDGSLLPSIVSALKRSGLDPSQLCLEVTESAAMRDVARSEDALNQLQDLGIELAIDDFGTGYSSLAYLKRFPFDTLKIDRSFVHDLTADPDDTRFVASIISLATSLGMSVVAEGIETQAQVDILVGLGCGRGQGYLFGKPAPAADLRVRIANA